MISGTDKDFRDTDSLLYKVLADSGNLKEFLENVFGFLFRCTDFYQINKGPSDPQGLPKGSARELLLSVFENWERVDNEVYSQSRENKETKGPPPCPNETGAGEEICSPMVDADVFNGAYCDGYRWAQTQTDLDVRVPVEASILTARDVNVVITSTGLNVEVGSADAKRTLVEGNLRHEIRPGDSVWTLLPGQHIHVVLEKKTPRWWDALLTKEKALDISKLHRTRPLEDLPELERDAVIDLLEKHQARERNKDQQSQ